VPELISTKFFHYRFYSETCYSGFNRHSLAGVDSQSG
jgi:hypothetical protein